MNDNIVDWMKLSILIAKQTLGNKLKVGVVVVSSKSQLICSSYTNENGNSWSDNILEKLQKKHINNVDSIYITINTITEQREFDLNKILKKISINNIYVGLPDPKLNEYKKIDPIINFENVFRYPDELAKEIIRENTQYYEQSRQNIIHNSYYSEKRISTLVLKRLNKEGIVLTKEELNSNKDLESLVKYIVSKHSKSFEDTYQLLTKILSDAFNEKYALYDYSNDARSLNESWKDNFLTIYKENINGNIEKKNIIDVGVGGGNEAIALFSKCKNITFVDIAKDGLKKIKTQFPMSNTICSRAEDLSIIHEKNLIFIYL